MNVFICHASEQASLGEAIEMALRAEGHDAFLDRSDLPAGESYHDRIRAAIAASDVFLFLISPASVTAGRYTLSELDLARARWARPSGRILPVLVAPTPLDAIPQYLRAVTILEPRGNVPAAVVAAVASLARPWWRRALTGRLGGLVVLALAALGAAGWWGYGQLQARREVATLLRASDVEREAGNYAQAWATQARAEARAPGRREVQARQEELAMQWLDNIRVTVGQDTFTAIVERVRPVLARCAAGPAGPHAADCLAHLGWSDYLRTRDGASGLDPAASYRRALAIDPANPYAGAMWGFHVLERRGSLAEARALFTAALASGRARSLVRRLQLSALVYHHTEAGELEAIRVANELRVAREPLPPGIRGAADPWGLWPVYDERLIQERGRAELLALLPASDHLATFRWLFPAATLPADRQLAARFVEASFQELGGERADALAAFRAVANALTQSGRRDGPLPRATARALARLER